MTIDCSNSWLELKIGDDVKRQLVKHFQAFIREAIGSRGHPVRDPSLFNQETLDKGAWELASKVASDLETAFCHTQGEGKYAVGAFFVRDMIDLVILDVQDAALAAGGAVGDLIKRASGLPRNRLDDFFDEEPSSSKP